MKYSIRMALIAIGINLFSINTTWSPTQGWYIEWAQLSNSVAIYRDFYVPLPPFFVWLHQLIVAAEVPLALGTRILDLVVFVYLAISILKLSSVLFEKSIAFIGSVITIILFQIDPANTISGYFEFAVANICLGMYFYLTGNVRQSYVGGVLISISALTKQIYIFPVLAVFVFEGIRYFKSSHNKRKSLSTLLGIITPQSCFLLTLIINDSLDEFLHAMLEGGGKNPQFQRIPTWFVESVFTEFAMQATVILVVTFFVVRYLPYRFGSNNLLMSLLSSIVMLIITRTHQIPFLVDNFGRLSVVVGILIFISLYWINLVLCKYLGKIPLVGIVWALSLCTFVAIEVTMRRNSLAAETFYTGVNKIASEYYIRIGGTLNIIGIIGFLVLLRGLVRQRKGLFPNTNSFDDKSKLLNLIVSLVVTGVINILNGGFSYIVNIPWMIFSLCYLCTLVIKALPKSLLIFQASFFLSVSIFLIQYNVYSWYGWNEKFTRHNLQPKSSSLPESFRYMYLTEFQSSLYEDIYKKIQVAEKSLLFDRETQPTFASIPMQPIFNQFSKLGRFYLACPVQHFDVCPERILAKDYYSIRTKGPNLLLYWDLGEEFITSNEAIWREGQTSYFRGIREIILNSSKYRVLAKWERNAMNLSDIYLLERI